MISELDEELAVGNAAEHSRMHRADAQRAGLVDREHIAWDAYSARFHTAGSYSGPAAK